MHWSPPDDSPYSDYPYYDGPRQRHPRPDERLRHLVFLDGRLIDTWTEQVEGTAYHSWAQEFDRSLQPRIHAPTSPAPHEAVLDWLDGVVGGRAALLALDDRPLEPRELPDDLSKAYADVVGLLERLSADLFDAEFLAAACAALATLRRTDPEVLEATPAEVAGGLCWMVGRANGSVGAGTSITQKVLKRELWLKVSLTPRATMFRTCLRGLLAEPSHRPHACPNLLELGDPEYLTSTTRRELVRLRDRALAAAEVARTDQEARKAILP